MGNNNKIEHQFLRKEFFLPNWNIKTLVLGSFNPMCGEKTDYFYGRCQNNFWRTIEEIHNLDYMWFQNSFERKLKFMKNNGFGCTDIIQLIELSNSVERKEICGSGYKDQILFTAKKCTITYNFEEIKVFIKRSNLKKIIHTWGERKSPVYFKRQIDCLKDFCKEHNVLFIENCPSPSGRLRGKVHKENLIKFYELHLTKTSP